MSKKPAENSTAPDVARIKAFVSRFSGLTEPSLLVVSRKEQLADTCLLLRALGLQDCSSIDALEYPAQNLREGFLVLQRVQYPLAESYAKRCERRGSYSGDHRAQCVAEALSRESLNVRKKPGLFVYCLELESLPESLLEHIGMVEVV